MRLTFVWKDNNFGSVFSLLARFKICFLRFVSCCHPNTHTHTHTTDDTDAPATAPPTSAATTTTTEAPSSSALPVEEETTLPTFNETAPPTTAPPTFNETTPPTDTTPPTFNETTPPTFNETTPPTAPPTIYPGTVAPSSLPVTEPPTIPTGAPSTEPPTTIGPTTTAPPTPIDPCQAIDGTYGTLSGEEQIVDFFYAVELAQETEESTFLETILPTLEKDFSRKLVPVFFSEECPVLRLDDYYGLFRMMRHRSWASARLRRTKSTPMLAVMMQITALGCTDK